MQTTDPHSKQTTKVLETPMSTEDKKQSERQRAVEDAVHSGQMEGLDVSKAFEADAEAYVNGTISLDEFGRLVRARNIHV